MPLSARCTVTGDTFTISAFEREYCRTFDIPLPVISPLPRLRNLGAFRNRTYLYHGQCAHTGRKILTSIAPERGFIVWDRDVFESDEYSPASFGRNYDFNRPFFQQFEELLRSVPLPNLSTNRPTMENSDFTNGITGAKNCYLIFSSSFNEDCLYSKLLYKCRDVVGCVLAKECELCYACSGVHRCYNVLFSENCHDCADSAFLSNCQSCRNCFGCVNLTQKEYHFFNEPLSKDEYQRRINGIFLGSHRTVEDIRTKYAAFREQFAVRAIEGLRNENSTGQYLNNTKNCASCYSVSEAEDLESCIYVNDAHSSLFWFGYGNSSRGIYSSVTVGDSSENVRFSFECWPSVHDLEYCAYLHRGSHDCFGSVGLRKSAYCILNKQYSKEDYHQMVRRIKEHMRSTGEYGRFFPFSCSPNYFNRSEGYDWMPLGKDAALRQGFHWLDSDDEEHEMVTSLPDDVRDVGDDFLQTALTCEVSGKQFKLQKAELDFHRRRNLALPRVAPLERIRLAARFLEVVPLRPTVCGACSASIVSAREQSLREILCEQCFRSRSLDG